MHPLQRLDFLYISLLGLLGGQVLRLDQLAPGIVFGFALDHHSLRQHTHRERERERKMDAEKKRDSEREKGGMKKPSHLQIKQPGLLSFAHILTGADLEERVDLREFDNPDSDVHVSEKGSKKGEEGEE